MVNEVDEVLQTLRNSKNLKAMKAATLSRRGFLKTVVASRSFIATESRSTAHPSASLINGTALVGRHNPVVRKLEPLSPLSVGNGEFAFTADITGLQSFPQAYENAMPLCTMSQWGWHSAPQEFEAKTLRLTQYNTYGRAVGYATSSAGQR